MAAPRPAFASPGNGSGRPHDGPLGRNSGDDDDLEATKSLLDAEMEAFIDGLWFRAQPVTDSPAAMAYYAGRNLDVAAGGAASQLRWLGNCRGDEGAVLAYVGGQAGELVALQLLHLTSSGEKSTVQPIRKILRGPSDWRSRGLFRLGSAGAVTLAMGEGVEDAIALAMAGAPRACAALGAGGFGRAQLPLGINVVVLARDDDPPGSPATLMFARGAASVALQGRLVKITARAGTLLQGAKDIADVVKADVALGRRMLNETGEVRDCLDQAEKEALS
jgi:hypothetical protein